MDEGKVGLVLLLLREGSTTEAIKLYQDETGARHWDASRSVAELARRHGIATGFSSQAVAGAILGLLALLTGILAAF